MDFLSSWIFSAILVIVPSILVCIVGLILVRKWISVHELKANHDVAGFTFGIVGVLYSVILGFTVVNVQNRFNEVEETIYTEAIALTDLYREASFFSPAGKDAVRSSLRNYVEYVIQNEWGGSKSKTIHRETQKILDQIWDSYYQVELTDEKMKTWYQQSISRLDTFLNARIARQFQSGERLSDLMWAILLIGALITICFMYFFGLERIRAQIIMTALVAGYISLMLFLVYSLDHVFQGPHSIQPAAYQQILELFNEWDAPL